MIENIKGINMDSEEGKLLIAALVIITTEARTSQTPSSVIKDLYRISKSIE